MQARCYNLKQGLTIMTATSTFEIIQMAAQKRVSMAAISKRVLAAKATSIGPAHIRAALMYTARKAN
jgi:hypothetical protein